jgi:hypothetical protein
MSTPLENERRALLERMNASREDYRSRFVHTEDEHHPAVRPTDVFPRSRTFKFIARHPYYASLGLLAAMSAVPSRSLSKAVKGGVAVTAGILGSSARTLLVRQVLPSMIRSFRSARQT